LLFFKFNKVQTAADCKQREINSSITGIKALTLLGPSVFATPFERFSGRPRKFGDSGSNEQNVPDELKVI